MSSSGRSWCPSPAGRCRSPTRGSARSTPRCAPTPGCSTSPTWARSRSRGPGALAFLQRVLSNDVAKIEIGGAQYSCLCNEDGGVLDDLFAYRLGGDRYLIVTNAANHDDRPRLARALEPRLRRRRPRRRRPLRDARRAGPARPRDRRRDAAGSSCRRGCTSPRSRIGRRPALVCGTGYTGEDGVELLIDPEVAPRDLGRAARRRRRPLRARRPRHPAARGLLPPARQRPHPRAQPDRGRPRLVLQGGDRLHRLRGDRPRPRRGHRPRSWRRSRSRAPASRARATRSSPAARRSASSPAAPSRPRSRSGSGWPTCAPTSPSPGPRSRSTCAASAAPPG